MKQPTCQAWERRRKKGDKENGEESEPHKLQTRLGILANVNGWIERHTHMMSMMISCIVTIRLD